MKLLSSVLLITAAGWSAAQTLAPPPGEGDPLLDDLLDPAFAETGNIPSVTVDLAAGEPPTGEGEPTSREPEGVTFEVEGGDAGAEADPSEIRLLAPFPAKPLSEPPPGWKLIHPDVAPPFAKAVTLPNGREITLSIRPHVLVPEDDGDQVLALDEPGFDPADGYAQRETIGAVLADSIAAHDANSHRLDEAARRLEQLLSSLPSPTTGDTDVAKP